MVYMYSNNMGKFLRGLYECGTSELFEPFKHSKHVKRVEQVESVRLSR